MSYENQDNQSLVLDNVSEKFIKKLNTLEKEAALNIMDSEFEQTRRYFCSNLIRLCFSYKKITERQLAEFSEEERVLLSEYIAKEAEKIQKARFLKGVILILLFFTFLWGIEKLIEISSSTEAYYLKNLKDLKQIGGEKFFPYQTLRKILGK